MKMKIMAALSLVFALGSVGVAETIHQQTDGKSAYTSNGGSALDAKLLETKDISGSTVSRVVGSMSQWGFVTYWLGIPTPVGKSVVRMRLYKSEEASAKYLLYLSLKSGQKMLQELRPPAEAAVGTFVNVDIAVDSDVEWSGLVLKKADASANPGPWIESIQVLINN